MDIDAALARQLIAAQFPRWADLPVAPVAQGGNDNRTFRLGDEMSVRLPSAEPYAAHVAVEYEWLPRLAPHLPLPIPAPLALGAPDARYPWPWTVNRWIRGERATAATIADQDEFARDLAGFLNVLQALDATNAPEPGQHNFYRGGDLSVYDPDTRECLATLSAEIDADATAAAWEAALAAQRGQPPAWVHGDVAEGNLLVDAGRLCAVIDFGQLAAGDPSCDLTVAWTLLSDSGREVFRATVDADEATWTRARGWGLWKALLQIRKFRANNPPAAARAERVLRAILAD